jgi:hypothetical protein
LLVYGILWYNLLINLAVEILMKGENTYA